MRINKKKLIKIFFYFYFIQIILKKKVKEMVGEIKRESKIKFGRMILIINITSSSVRYRLITLKKKKINTIIKI